MLRPIIVETASTHAYTAIQALIGINNIFVKIWVILHYYGLEKY